MEKNTLVAVGPVIIENNKILLNREKSKNSAENEHLFMLPGGKLDPKDLTLEETCKRECKEELGIDIEIIRPLRPVLADSLNGKGQFVLIHYLAKRIGEIIPGDETIEWGWYDIHNLPENSTDNIHLVIEDYLKKI